MTSRAEITYFFIGEKQNVFWYHSIVLADGIDHHMPFLQTLIIKFTIAFGILFAVLIYFYKTNLPKVLSYNLSVLYAISLNKWYVDEFYNNFFVKPFFYLASFFWKKGDINLIDAYGPNGISRLVNLFSKRLSIFQSGYLYHYAFVMLVGLVIILTWFIFY